KRCRELFIAERMARIDSLRIQGAHAPLLEVAAREGHQSSSRDSFCSAIFACRRFAGVDLPCAPPLPSRGERATGLRGRGSACCLARFKPDLWTPIALRTTHRPRAAARLPRRSRRAARRAATPCPPPRSERRRQENRAVTTACNTTDPRSE